MKLFLVTGTCGAGKSTLKDELAARLDPGLYACVDSDETGLNWWDYAGTAREGQYGADSLREAFGIARGRNLVFVTCMAPHDYITKAAVPEELTATFWIALWAADQIIDRRLRDRPPERGFTTEEAIRPHIEYNQWICRNRGKYQLLIDTGSQAPDAAAEKIAAFVTGLTEERGPRR